MPPPKDSPIEKAIKQIELRRKLLGISQRALSEQAGMAPNYLNQAVAGKAKPKAETLFNFAQALGCTIEDLYAGNGSIKLESHIKPTRTDNAWGNASVAVQPIPKKSQSVSIPEYDVLASAGGGSHIEQEPLKYMWEFDPVFIHQLGVAARNAVIVEVRGDSMEPTLNSGDRIMIDRADTNVAMPGVFLIFDGGGTVVKRIEKVYGSDPLMVRLLSDNERHSAYKVDAASIHIIGRVCWRGGRL